MTDMIRAMKKSDIRACAEILCAVYNNELWQCRWTMEAGTAYLDDYFEAKKFTGLVVEEDEKLIGALFAHEKIWWNNSDYILTRCSSCPKDRGADMEVC